MGVMEIGGQTAEVGRQRGRLGYLARLEYREQRTASVAKVGEKVGESLTVNQQAIIECMRNQPSVSAKEIGRLIGISIRKTEENIKKLREQRESFEGL